MAASAPKNRKNRNNRNRNNRNQAAPRKGKVFTYRWGGGEVSLPLDPPAGTFLAMARLDAAEDAESLMVLGEVLEHLPADVVEKVTSTLPTSKLFSCIIKWTEAVMEHVSETVSEEVLETVSAGK